MYNIAQCNGRNSKLLKTRRGRTGRAADRTRAAHCRSFSLRWPACKGIEATKEAVENEPSMALANYRTALDLLKAADVAT
ncbi:hypothetical protein EVAR_64064_1 [Eumeta japonica]|uniref:Uncharacterized protein n=1 Tax=Eumeta variegata TaxID=151549 RepID=A0A4C1ZZ31_EUMVA|nr:hypothetical protein EVAR_64064_1 [Eumeta japonica]